MTQKKTDSTIAEIHDVRRKISDRFGGDVYAIARDAAARQAASKRPVWKSGTQERSADANQDGGATVDEASTVGTG